MSKKGSTYVEDSNIGFYSSMSEHIDLRLIKGKKEVVYGLHERGHSPTLIYPRPKWVKSDYGRLPTGLITYKMHNYLVMPQLFLSVSDSNP